MTPSKRDANEAKILEGLRGIGAWYCQMDRNAGFDLLLGFRGRLYVVEIKDPAQPPSKRRLTENEVQTVERMNRSGCTYYVAQTLDDVLKVIGAL